MRELKLKFKELIDNNLKSDELLNKIYLNDYYDILNKEKDKLKFYKYCDAEYYSIRNIEKNTLSFKRCSKFNDPFEGATLTSDEKDKEYLNTIRNSAVISCVSENKNDLLMFAHYADSYQGFCVEYDLKLLDKKIFKRIMKYFFPVIYSKVPEFLKLKDKLTERINGYKEKSSSEKLDDVMSYFFHKANVWKYEHEWRFIVPIDKYNVVFGNDVNIDGDVILFNNFDCLSAVYLGLNMPLDKKEHIFEIVSRHNENRKNKPKIKLFNTSLNESKYKLDETEVNNKADLIV